MKYAIKTGIFNNETLIIDKDRLCWIPCDEANMDYQDYLAWLAEGNIPELWNPEEQ